MIGMLFLVWLQSTCLGLSGTPLSICSFRNLILRCDSLTRMMILMEMAAASCLKLKVVMALMEMDTHSFTIYRLMQVFLELQCDYALISCRSGPYWFNHVLQ